MRFLWCDERVDRGIVNAKINSYSSGIETDVCNSDVDEFLIESQWCTRISFLIFTSRRYSRCIHIFPRIVEQKFAIASSECRYRFQFQLVPFFSPPRSIFPRKRKSLIVHGREEMYLIVESRYLLLPWSVLSFSL